MNKHFISFADSKFYNALNKLKNEAENSEFFNHVKMYNEFDLSDDILKYCNNNQKGYGFWIWKPIIVKKHFDSLNENDLLVYADAGCSIYQTGKEIFESYINHLNTNDAIFFQMEHKEKTWTKMDTIIELGGEDLLDTGQLTACCFLLKKNDKTKKIINDWFEASVNKRNLIDDTISISKNDETFMEHRYDQSILSIIVKKNKIELFDDHTWKFYSHGSKDYPINCTRRRY